MSEVCCKDCRWWYCSSKPADPEFLKISNGDCRLVAPKTFQLGGVSYDAECKTVWPHTQGSDFCGNFQQKDDRAARLLGSKFMVVNNENQEPAN